MRLMRQHHFAAYRVGPVGHNASVDFHKRMAAKFAGARQRAVFYVFQRSDLQIRFLKDIVYIRGL